MATFGDVRKSYQAATASVTDRVQSYGLSILGAALLVSKEPEQSLLDVKLEGAPKLAAYAAAAAIALDFLQFLWRALFFGYLQRANQQQLDDSEVVESGCMPFNLGLIFVLFLVKSLLIVLAVGALATAILT